MNENLWYYELHAKQLGPVNVEEIQQLARRGVLSVENRVRPEASSHWISVADFAHALQESTMQNSRSSTKSLTTSSDVDERHSDLDIDMFDIQGDKEARRVDRNSELDIDSITLVSDSQAPFPHSVTDGRRRPAEFRPSVEQKMFLIKTNTQVIGPLPECRLIEMAEVGSLRREDLYQSGNGKWISVKTISSVYSVIARRDIEAAKAAAVASVPEAAPKVAKARPSSAVSAKAGAPVPRKRIRRAAPKDELLQEIFSEVFTEDGELNKQRLASAASSTPAVATNSNSRTTSQSPALTHGSSVAAPPVFKPVPKKYSKKKSSSGGFEMPSPKILGSVGGGVLALLLLVGSVNGFITIPGTGVDAEGFFKEVATAFPEASSGSAADWREFTSTYGKAAREIAKGLGSRSRNDKTTSNQVEAALLIVRMGRLTFADKEGRDKAFAEFNQLLLGTSG